MELKKVIVILYGKEKHEVIAAGVKSHLLEYSRDYDVVMVSDEQYTPDYNAVIKRKFYTFCQRNANWLYGIYSKASENKALKAYNKQRKKNAEIALPTEKLKRQVAYVKNVLYRFDPEAVVCMTPDALKLALTVREINNIKTRVVSYLPDFGADLRFLDKRCDKYFIANNFVKKQLIKMGISEEKIMVTGITYAKNLKESYSKVECRKELNLDNDNPLVVLSGGKYGCLKIADDFNKIIGSICQFNLVALTGGNKKLGALMKAFKTNENTKNIIITDEADMKKLLCLSAIL
jgi:UDP-N-acetylglucosamine:LPS N-acetylglucosamine transferase